MTCHVENEPCDRCHNNCNTDLNSIISGDKDFAFEDSDSFAKMGFSQKEFNAENEELVDVDEEPEEDEDDSDFFDDVEENTLDEE